MRSRIEARLEATPIPSAMATPDSAPKPYSGLDAELDLTAYDSLCSLATIATASPTPSPTPTPSATPTPAAPARASQASGTARQAAKDAKAYANLATSRTTPTDPNAIAAAKAARLAGAEAILAKKNSAMAAAANTPEEKEAAASAAEGHALEAKRQMNLAYDAYSKVK